jgi:hypothetical protein
MARDIQIHYADEWAALYVDGDLVERTVGDSYIAEEHALNLLGVKQVHDDAFMRGGNDRSTVANTLMEVDNFRFTRQKKRIEAARLRAEAARLLDEAEELAPK